METKKSSRVLTCEVDECTYNCSNECCAPNIEVGDVHQTCDTFTTSEAQLSGGVAPEIGICHVERCMYNITQRCNAGGINVLRHSQHADCGTFDM